MLLKRMKNGMNTVSFILISIIAALVGYVQSSLKITQESATKLENETFFVVCRDDAGSPVKWISPRGQQLGLKTRPIVHTASYGTMLLFNQTTQEDTGTYSCVAGRETREFQLKIETPLTFMDTYANQTGIEGNDLHLKCEVKGGKVTWSVEEGGDIADKKFSILGDGLLIKNVHRTDSKTYVCKAFQSTTGVVQDRKIKLRVLHKPVFLHPTYAKQEQAYGYINGTVNLTCTVLADPSPRFEWFKNHDKIEKIGRVFDVAPDVSVLQLHVSKSTFGNYKCVATNPYGRLEKHFSLDPGSKPPPPRFLELRGTNSDFLDLGIRPAKHRAAPGMEPHGFHVQYRPPYPTEQNWQERDFNLSQDNSYILMGLTPDTDYQIRAATRNLAGLSDYTNISTFKTLTSGAYCNYQHATVSFSAQFFTKLILILLVLLQTSW